MCKYLTVIAAIFLLILNACGDIAGLEPLSLPIDTLSLSPNEGLLSDDMANTANTYYSKPYRDAPHDFVQATIDQKAYRIFRPNHGLLHGLRKAALAINAATILSTSDSSLAPWIHAATDPRMKSYNQNFLQQLSFGLLMLRTGRESEKNDKYREYSYRSAENFAREAPKTGLFPRPKDVEDFIFAIQTVGDVAKCFDEVNGHYIYTKAHGCTSDRLNLYSFMYGVHHLDLRRMVGFSKNDIFTTTAQLFGLYKDGQPNINAEAIKKLWQLSGEYLRVTGDRDMDGMPPTHRLYKKPFYLLSNNPALARKRVEEVLKLSLAAAANQPGISAISKIVIAPADKNPNEIKLIIAEPKPTDIWYNYRARPEIDQVATAYPPDVVKKAKTPSLRFRPGTHMPWSLKAIPDKNKSLFNLADVVPDRIYEKASNKLFVEMYHGTTSDLLGSFKGAGGVRFDLGKGALGTGFYLTADLNEAKYYACERLKARRTTGKDIKAIVLVYGVETNNAVRGKYLPNIPLSDDITGAPLDPEIYFKRNANLYNQFAFFKNSDRFLKLFAIVELADGFSKSKDINDFDGMPKKLTPAVLSKEFYCNP